MRSADYCPPPERLCRSPSRGRRWRTGKAGSAAAAWPGITLACISAVLGACASAPEVVTKSIAVAQQAASSAATTVAAAVPVITEAPVAPEAQRAFDAARADLRAGRTAEAERGFRDLAARHPQLGGAHANLGLILRNAGKHDESIAALEQAVKVSPKQPVYFNQLGVSYRHKGRFDKARDAYEQALSLDAAYADAHLNLGVLLDLYLGDSASALSHYERYLELGGDAAVGKWVADLKNRKPVSVAQAVVKSGAKKE
jgi:tetratricopeptide (TPR) repeat protein